MNIQPDVMCLDLNTLEEAKETKEKKQKKIGILVMVDKTTRYMMARTVAEEQALTLQKAFKRSWIRMRGPSRRLFFVDEHPAFASDHTMKWAEEHSVEMRISPGQSHTKTSLVARDTNYSGRASRSS